MAEPHCNSSPSHSANRTREGALQGYSIVKLHTCIIALIGIFGFCLQLKFPNVSPYSMVHGTQLMNAFIVVTFIYLLSIIVMAIVADHNNADVEDVMLKITLLLGSLSLIIELLVLLSPFRMTLLFFWSICLVWFVRKSYHSLKTLFHTAAARLVPHVGELKQKLIDLSYRLMESNAIAAVARVLRKVKDLVIRNDGCETEPRTRTNHTTEVPV